MTTSDASGELAGRLGGARVEAAGFEAERMLGSLRERLFGVAAEPQRIGRFVVLRRLGAGGMGIVYLGYDGELDRKVALKLLRVQGGADERAGAAAARLLREARALARVDHPNVIAIHEVGEHEGAVFIAMELALGVTLQRWQADAPRSWREIVALYVEAGRGLAAAHAAGVIHRDFKPDNVLVSDDPQAPGRPRVRVGDFGLARAAGDAGDDDDDAIAAAEAPAIDASTLATFDPEDLSRGTSSRTPAIDVTLTATGALLGTPAYMAPEQFLGRRADARSDQFAFALALHEALVGARAFAGDDAEALAAAVIGGHRRPVPARLRRPRWLWRVIDRALEIAPERRYPSMLALLADLEAGLRRVRHRRLAAGASLLAITAAITGAAINARPALCTHAAAALGPAWNDDARAAAAAAFARTELAFAAPAWAQVERRLDAYADAWRAMHTAACEATHVHGAQSGAALDLRMRCLERRRGELQALVELFVVADERAVLHAVEATDALTPIERCADPEALAAALALPDDPAARARAREIRGELAKAKALRDAGHYAEALALATPAHAAALALDFAPLRADAGVILGGVQALAGAPTEAATTLDQAFVDALASGHAEAAAWAAITATHVVGSINRERAEGRRWAHLAAPLLQRSGGDPRASASLEGNLGTIAVADGDLEEARARFEASLRITEAAFGADDVMIAKMTANLATVHRRAGDHDLALAAYRRAREVFAGSLGADHPALATLANNTGALLWAMGDLDGAERSYQEVLAFAGGSLPAASPTLGHAHSNYGELLVARGRPTEAAAHYREAIAIWERSRGPSHPLVALALVGLATARLDVGDPEGLAEATASLGRALEIYAGSDASPAELAVARFEQARAAALAADDDGASIALAEAALADLPDGEAKARAQAWIDARRGG